MKNQQKELAKLELMWKQAIIGNKNT